jgi:hypothetical protein
VPPTRCTSLASALWAAPRSKRLPGATFYRYSPVPRDRFGMVTNKRRGGTVTFVQEVHYAPPRRSETREYKMSGVTGLSRA